MAKRGSRSRSSSSGSSSKKSSTKKTQQKPASADESSGPDIPAARLHVWQVQAVRDVLVVAAVIAVFWAGYALRAVTVPLLVALLLAYLFEPLIQRMCRHPRISRVGAVTTLLISVIGLFVIVIALIVPLVIGQTARLIDDIRDGRMRQRISRLENAVPGVFRDDFEALVDQLPMGALEEGLDEALPQPVEDAVDALAGVDSSGGAANGDGGDEGQPTEADGMSEQRIEEIVSQRVAAEIDQLRAELRQGVVADEPPPSDVWGLARRGLATFFDILGSLIGIGLLTFLIPFYFFFFSLWYPKVLEFGRELLPKKNRERVLDLLQKMDEVVAGFVRGRIVISFIMGVMLAIGWTFASVPYAIPLGIVVGIFCAVPYLGGIGIPLAVGLLFYGELGVPADERMAWYWIIIWPTLVFAIVQVIEGYVLTPMIAGKATKLDPVTIVVAVIAGGSVLGVYGMLLAIPVAACGKILFNEVLLPRIKAWTRGELADPLPIERD